MPAGRGRKDETPAIARNVRLDVAAECRAMIYDVDFSLALYNRTGKYFIGRDILEANKDLVGTIYFWRIPRRRVPGRLLSRAIGWAQVREGRLLSRGRSPFWPRGSRRPVLHLDPATVVHTQLKASDVVLCHDLGPITHPELFTPSVVELYRHAYQRIARTSPRVVCVSHASERAFRAAIGGGCETAIIYPPIREELRTGRGDAPSAVRTPFLLTVGSIGARKNQKASIEAFGMSGLAARGWSYVLCGSHEPGADEVLALAGRTPGVTVLPYVSDAELAWLYRSAGGFVLVSLLEGFGVPVAEAIGYGIIPIISHDSVLEEVAGEGALSVNPTDITTIVAAMRCLADMDAVEKSTRGAQMARSISRFSHANFDLAWRCFLSRQPIPT